MPGTKRVPVRTERIAVRVDPELYQAIKACAEADHRTVSSWVEVSLRDAVERTRAPRRTR